MTETPVRPYCAKREIRVYCAWLNNGADEQAAQEVKMSTATVFAPEEAPIVGIPAIAKATGLTERRVRYLIELGELPVGKIGRAAFTKPRWIAERFNQQMPTNSKAAA
jgi:hypothetical protein